MDDQPPENFDDAVSQFLKFLRDANFAESVAWVFPEDVVLADGSIYLKMPLAPENVEGARRKYREGLRQGLGIELGVVCKLGACACSLVYFPKDEDEAQRSLMGYGLKITHPIGASGREAK